MIFGLAVVSFAICVVCVVFWAMQQYSQRCRPPIRVERRTVWYTMVANAWRSFHLLCYLLTVLCLGTVLTVLSYLLGISPIFVLLLLALGEIVETENMVYGTS